MSAEVDLDVRFSAAIGHVTDAIGSLRKDLRRLADAYPVPADFGASAVYPAAGNLLLVANPGPPQGYIWALRSLRISAADALSSPAGTAYAFVGPTPNAGPGMGASGSWFDKTASAFPVPAFYARGQVVLRYPEVVYIIITGGTVGVTYRLGGTAEQTGDLTPELLAP